MSSRRNAPGIRRDRSGWRVFQRVAPGPGGLLSKRFPLDTPERDMIAWQEDQRAAHRQRRAVHSVKQRGTLAADVVRYLLLVQTMPSYTDRVRDLQSWVDVLGMRRRHDLTREDYGRVLQQWRLAGGAVDRHGKATPLAASTVNHRRTALMHLYTTLDELDGRQTINPLKAIPIFDEPPPEPRDLGLPVAAAILSKLRRNKTGARIHVLAWTAIRGNSELSRIRREHIDLERRLCWVPTGKGGEPRQLRLNAEGVAAWQQFIDLKAFGTYSRSSLRKSFLLAVAKVNIDRAKAKLPPLVGVRPYDLRHTVATALRRAGADLADVQAYLGHRSQKMTQRYAPYASVKLQAAIDAIGAKELPTEVTHPPTSD